MRRLPQVLSLTVTLTYVHAQVGDDSHAKSDSSIFSHVIELSRQRLWQELLPGDIVANVGREFVGSPYLPFTLEEPGQERLVVNLRGFDCVTFIENVLAVARCIQSETSSFASYKNNLRVMRYRGGILDGYPSRLHYFSEWLDDNAGKGFVRDVTRELGGLRLEKNINWMTRHREAYRQMRDTVAFKQIAGTESQLSETARWYIPSDSIYRIESRLHNGDIVAAVSSREGLDVAHAGIAVRTDDGSLHYMHAPDVKGNVKISEEPLHVYMESHRAFVGIMVARPVYGE